MSVYGLALGLAYGLVYGDTGAVAVPVSPGGAGDGAASRSRRAGRVERADPLRAVRARMEHEDRLEALERAERLALQIAREDEEIGVLLPVMLSVILNQR